MIKTNINKLSLLKLYKRDLVGKIILKRKSLTILKFLRKVYKIKKSYSNNINRKNTNFFRILNIPRPQYNRRKTKYGKYFFLRQQFRIFYGFLRIRTLQLIIKKSFKKMNSINYFLYLMESRLDVILYRLNFVSSVRMARQLIVHGNVLINNRIIRNPNYNFKKKDILTFDNKNIYKYKLLLYYNIVSKLWPKVYIPNYIEYNIDIFIFKFTKLNIYDIPFFFQINTYTFLTIMNFYTKSYF